MPWREVGEVDGPGRALELRLHELVVGVPLDGVEHPERNDAVRPVCEPRECERGRQVGLVVHDPGTGYRRAMLEVQPVLLVVADDVEGAVVVDVAVLVDLDERRPAVRRSATKDVGQTRLVGVDCPRDERSVRAESE